MAVAVWFFGCQSEPPVQQVMEDPAADSRDDSTDGDGPLYTRPLPVEDIPPEFRFSGDWERVRDWVYNLSTDDLQRYQIVWSRGCDPRLDVPEDFTDRAGTIEHLMRLGLYLAGVEVAGNQAEWLRTVVDRADGSLMFVRASNLGPNWGWTLSSASGLDEDEDPLWTEEYFLWRPNGSPNNAPFPWTRTANWGGVPQYFADGYVHTSHPPVARFVGGNVTYSCITERYPGNSGMFRGMNQSVRHLGDPFWYTGWDYGTTGHHPYWGPNIEGLYVDPSSAGRIFGGMGDDTPLCPDYFGDVSPAAVFIQKLDEGPIRTNVLFRISSTSFAHGDGCDSCWFIATDGNVTTPDLSIPGCANCAHWFDLGEYCAQWLVDTTWAIMSRYPSQDSCFWTSGNHNARPWSNIWAGVSYTGPGNTNPNDVRRAALYDPSDFFTGQDSIGGWMNQSIFRKMPGGMLIRQSTDSMTSPKGGRGSPSGNEIEKLISIPANTADSTTWLDKDLQIGCRPFWRWEIIHSNGTTRKAWWMQLDSLVGNESCSADADTFNSWAGIEQGNNPIYCSAMNAYVGTVTYSGETPYGPPTGLQAHPGVMYPTIRLTYPSSRGQDPFNPNQTTSTTTNYRFCQSTLATGTLQGGGSYYLGTVLRLTWTK